MNTNNGTQNNADNQMKSRTQNNTRTQNPAKHEDDLAKTTAIDPNMWSQSDNSSLYIPLIPHGVTKSYLKDLLDNVFEIGDIARIDITGARDGSHAVGFVHLNKWFNTHMSHSIRKSIVETGTYDYPLRDLRPNASGRHPTLRFLINKTPIKVEAYNLEQLTTMFQTMNNRMDAMASMVQAQALRIAYLEDELDNHYIDHEICNPDENCESVSCGHDDDENYGQQIHPEYEERRGLAMEDLAGEENV